MVPAGRNRDVGWSLGGHPSWAVKRPDIDPLHAGAASGFDSEVGIFVDEAVFGCHAEAAGCFQEDVWFGLVPTGVFGCDHGIEQAFEADMGDLFGDDIAEAATGDRHRQFAMIFAHDRGDGGDLFEQVHVVEEHLFLFPSDSENIELHVRFVGQHLDDLIAGDASQGVETVFGELDPESLHGLVPGHEMKRHRVGQRTVAIKNQSLNHRANQG